MTEHASALALDEVAAGLSTGEALAHVQACPSCRARLAEVASGREAVLADPQLRKTFARLPEAPGRRRWAWLLAAPAVAALLFVAVRPEPGLRAKGSAGIDLVAEPGHDAAAPRVGDRMELRLSSGNHRYVLVAAVDESGHATPLLHAGPVTEARSAALAPGSRVAVPLLVTAGAVRLVAALSDQPLSLEDLRVRRAGPGVEFHEREVRPRP